MDETIYLKYLFKTEDIVTGYKYHRKCSNTYRILGFIYIAIGVINLLLGLYGVLVLADLSSWTTILFGLLFLGINRINLFFYAQNFKKLNYDNKQVEWEISQNKITYRIINLSESKFNWELIRGVADAPDGFLLYPQQNMFYWLPKYAFNNQEDIAHFVFIAKNNVKNWQQIG